MDIFGIEPKLFVNDNIKYNSNFGGFLTIILFGVVITAFYVYGNDMHYK